MKRIIFILFFCSEMTLSIAQQQHIRSITNRLGTENVPTLIMPDFDKNAYKKYLLSENQKDVAFVFAKTFDTNFDIKELGYEEQVKDGNIWRMKIKSKDAYSINLIFSNIQLCDNAELYIYNTDTSMIFGPFMQLSKRIYATPLIKGDEVIIELFEPFNVQISSNVIVSNVNHDVLDLFNTITKDGMFGLSSDCNIDINCALGKNWQNEKQSVCRIIINGHSYCSGALINNSDNDGKNYFLTANHCYKYEPQYENAVESTVFYFNYESPSCSGTDGNVNQVMIGATLLANSIVADFCLMRIDSDIPQSYNPYYSGWSRNDISPSASVCIHHPHGDVKKISTKNGYLSTITQTENNLPYNLWKVDGWTNGTTEGGSSGSPLYNQNHKIIGQLKSGSNANEDCYNYDYYGKLSSSWNGEGSPESNLKYWLNPLNNLTELSGLRYVRGQINSTHSVSGDIVKFSNVTIAPNSNINVHYNETVEIIGTFNAPIGTTLNITP